MAISQNSLVSKMEKYLAKEGYTKVQDEDNGRGYRRYSMPFLRAIAAAVVEEIQENAKAIDTADSGEWDIK
ncbi:hypothetical protein CWD68_00900 [Campylobacter jejuni]|uniref:hypothetical protein n=1 Tax=Campylobacter jejuni TaxID=197 RepID=UPI0012CFBEB6|nr:hypothetical protein [Campylobacter jejuni]EAL5442262.1 hypothetical protein [Campylobacter jejuni]NBE34223.1 hypothetical protein [Campylobacter jejuni]NBE86465.1 hypothetical protein [Campylobacter jejuni]